MERPSSIDVSSPTATDDGEFVTPTTSPLFERRSGSGRKSPDTVSTASSEGDLLKEILKEMDGGPKKGKEGEGEGEGIYSTLMRKKKRQQQQQQQQGEKQPVVSPK